ncbi:D-inositol 3-phosphate glycosyltransferase [Caulifigura coniformis]|uniref:D-inositol 3-phosphate glycosyltransferase n=1 Tax=Caulifigura coniformis TaxID=2527983 RepID=A0A517SI87_9PLAN|nr:glycosyltransferase family 4 protein [Caulifigura coniformis]QDT55838.1 D-inositol 3-phosphate glycosyltransferase [Caulifigura coniformis]
MRPAWSVFQLGAREHYAIPRALLARGVSTRLVTDLWFQGAGRRFLPRSLGDRSHPEISSRTVRSFNGPMLAFEAMSRWQGIRGWPLIEARNKRFGRLASTIDMGEIVFSYSYAALDVFEKARGSSRLVLGQIDPGPFEQDLVEQIHDRHGLARPPRPSPEYWERWNVEHELADVIVVNSEWSRTALVQRGVSSDKIAVIPLAFESKTLTSPPRDAPTRFTQASPLQILFLGQVIARKGVIELLQAARSLRNEPVKWLVVGGGDSTLLEQMAAEPSIDVVGPVARSTTEQFYRRSDVFILPTHSDGFALTQLEAAAFGLPLIVSRHCGDVVVDGVNGLTLGEVSPEAIVQTVKRILDQPALLYEMGEQMRNRRQLRIADLGERLTSSVSPQRVTR